MDGHTIILWYFTIINIIAIMIFGWEKLQMASAGNDASFFCH